MPLTFLTQLWMASSVFLFNDRNSLSLRASRPRHGAGSAHLPHISDTQSGSLGPRGWPCGAGLPVVIAIASGLAVGLNYRDLELRRLVTNSSKVKNVRRFARLKGTV